MDRVPIPFLKGRRLRFSPRMPGLRRNLYANKCSISNTDDGCGRDRRQGRPAPIREPGSGEVGMSAYLFTSEEVVTLTLFAAN